jgi:hypothetical protein
MTIRRLFAGLAIGILILGITSAVVAEETLNYNVKPPGDVLSLWRHFLC